MQYHNDSTAAAGFNRIVGNKEHICMGAAAEEDLEDKFAKTAKKNLTALNEALKANFGPRFVENSRGNLDKALFT